MVVVVFWISVPVMALKTWYVPDVGKVDRKLRPSSAHRVMFGSIGTRPFFFFFWWLLIVTFPSLDIFIFFTKKRYSKLAGQGLSSSG